MEEFKRGVGWPWLLQKGGRARWATGRQAGSRREWRASLTMVKMCCWQQQPLNKGLRKRFKEKGEERDGSTSVYESGSLCAHVNKLGVPKRCAARVQTAQ